MSSPEREDSIERRLREQAPGPVDARFTQRVLAALPPRARRVDWALQRSFAVSSRIGVLLALLVAAERGYRILGGGPEALFVVLLALIPAFAAAQSLCGPLFPSIGRHWR
jgi:hypothetical protein